MNFLSNNHNNKTFQCTLDKSPLLNYVISVLLIEQMSSEDMVNSYKNYK